ncbi:MAG TPA: bifunctional aspartate kinase/diaminopimelate decarboxylase [Gammaproteobacteria bacterium]|nr:bifunctional aspartate kinase/diaminopimelate decarboxylase [Gammaproteobacteria bacterium]
MNGNGWIVIKLGGTSVSSRGNWDNALAEARALNAAGKRVLMVQSALSGVTNALEALLAAPDEAALEAGLVALERRHAAFAQEMGIAHEFDSVIETPFQQLRKRVGGAHLTGEVTPRLRAEVMASGELMASALAARYIKDVAWVDARELLLAEPQANQAPAAQYLSAACGHAPDAALTAHLASLGPLVLTQGFIARNARGETVLLGRGGSDTSAAYLAAKLGAERIEIWTDVPGLFSADPRSVSAARLLKRLDYDEAQEIATSGGKVLHPRCIGPARAQSIPLHIRHTPDPSLPHSVIGIGETGSGARVKAVSLRRGVVLVSMETLGMWQQVGFLADAFACFKRHGLSVDLVSTSETCVTVSLDPVANAAPEGALDALLHDLSALCRPRLILGCAAVSLVGRQIRANLHRLAPALELFEERRVHLTSQAANDLNLTFVVDEADADRLVQQLHALLIPAAENDEVFGPTWESLQSPAPTATDTPWWSRKRHQLLALADEATPCYVYDTEAVGAAFTELRALSAVDRLFYAVKANPHAGLLRVMHAAGLGFETVSPGELAHLRGLFSDLDARRLLFTPNFAPRAEYRAGFEHGATVTLDNLHPLREWPEVFRSREIFLRLDTGLGAGHHRHVRTAGQASKFGIPLAELDDARALVARTGARITGLHAHVGSGILDPEVWLRNARLMMELAQSFPDVHVLNLGGGLGVPERPGEHGLELGRLDRGLADLKREHTGLELWLEPGRYLVARAGVLLARVTQLKGKGELRYLGVDAGMNSLIRPALYGAHHEIVNLTRLGERTAARYTVVGPICESGDVLGLDRPLPESREGDVLLIANAGAYGHAMSSHYNLREPAEERLLPA